MSGIPNGPDVNVELCYECLNEDLAVPCEAVGQGLCRVHLNAKYAADAYHDFMMDEARAASDDDGFDPWEYVDLAELADE